MRRTDVSNSEAAILSRVIQPDRDGLSAAAARALLKLEFTADDRGRMHELAVKNQAKDARNNNLSKCQLGAMV